MGYYEKKILAALTDLGRVSFGDVSRAVVGINDTASHILFREAFFGLVNAGRVRSCGTNDAGSAYLFEAV
jgi:hypothetical protein